MIKVFLNEVWFQFTLEGYYRTEEEKEEMNSRQKVDTKIGSWNKLKQE